MIQIQPIQLPFFGLITQVEVVIEHHKLLTSDQVVALKLYDQNGELFKTVELPIPQNIYNNWGVDDNYIVRWVLEQNNIQRIN